MRICVFLLTALLLSFPSTLRAQTSGYAVAFDGADDYLAAPDNPLWPADTNAFTVEAWVNFSSLPSSAVMIGQDEGGGSFNKWLIGYQSGKLFFHLNWPGGGSGIYPLNYPWTPSTGVYYHIAVSRRGSEYALYINGHTVLTGTDGTPVPAVTGDLTIGQAENMYFHGMLDEVRIWNSARTAIDIRQWMYRPVPGSEPDLTGYWRCDDNGSSYAADTKGVNHAVLMNGVQWIPSTVPFSISSFTTVVSSAAEFHCTGANLFAAFQSISAADTIIVTRIPSAPQGSAPAGVSTLHSGYWVLQSSGNGSFSADLTFGLGAGALTLADQEDPSGIKLFRREAGSNSAWTLVGTGSAASFGSVTFNGISQFGEFAIGTSTSSSLNGTEGIFQSKTSGTWNDAASWDLIGGSDDDGVPDGNDDVIIRAGDQMQYTAGGYVNNLLLLGGSAGTRLSVADNVGFYLYGILNSDALHLSPNLITTGNSANVNFVGSGRQIIGNTWSGDVAGWTVNISVSDTARVLTDFKAGTLGINSPVKFGTYDAPTDLYIDGGSENSGSLSVNGTYLFVSGSISRDSTHTSKFNAFTASWATIEIGGTYLSAENIKLGWPDYWYTITTTLRVKATSGLLINSGSYGHSGTLEYIGSAAQTTGNELIGISNINIKNPAGVQFLSSISITNLYLDTGSVTLPQEISLTAANLYAKYGSILGQGNMKVTERVETAHADGLHGVFQNTGTVVMDNWAYTIVFNGSVPQHTGTPHDYFKDHPSQNVSFAVDNASGVTMDGSYSGNTLTLTSGNITVNAPDTLSFITLNAGTGEILGTGLYIQNGGPFVSAHVNGVDGTVQTAGYSFVSPAGTGFTFNGSQAQHSGMRLPDSLGGLTIQNTAGFTFDKSVFVPSFDLASQGCDLSLSAGATFRTGSFGGGPVRKMYGAGNFTLSPGGYFSTQHPAGVNGTLQLTGSVTLGDSSVFSFGDASVPQVTGTLLPDTVQSIYFSNPSGTTITRPFQVWSILGIQNGVMDNSVNNVLLWDGAILQRNGGALAAIPQFRNYYDVNYAGWTGSAGNEIPDSSTVLRHLQGGNWITLTKNTTVNGNVGNHLRTDSFWVRVHGNVAPYMIVGHLRRFVSAPGQYVWDVADRDVQRYHPFTISVSALQDSDDITVTLYDTAVVQVPALPAGQKMLRYYYTAEQHSISNLQGTVSLTYNDGDVIAAGIPDDDSLRVMQWKNGDWMLLDPVTRDKSNNILTVGPIDTLTSFVIVGTEQKGIASFSVKEIQFGDVVRPDMKYDTLYIKNTGTWPLQFYGIVLNDPYTFAGALSSYVIPVGDSVQFIVSFNAYHGGLQTNVYLSHNGTTGIDTVVLKGRAIYPELAFSSYAPDFGTVPVGEERTDSITVYNTGTYPLIITELLFTSSNFSAVLSKDTIAVSDSALLYITFAPASEGTFNEWITFRNNIHNSGDGYRIYPSGIATASQFAVLPEALNFGNVFRGQSKKDSVSVKNPGAAVLHISNITSTIAGYTAAPSSADVPSGDSVWITVTFAPQSQGDFTGELVFHHSATTTTPDSVHLTGTGIEPVFSADKASFNFGSNVVGSTRKDSLFVTNTGNASLNIVSAVSSDSVQFSVTPASAAVLPGQKQKFTFAFTPASMGTQNAKVKFLHDGNPDTNIITVTGFGIQPVFTATRKMIAFGDVRIDSVRTDTLTVMNTGNSSLAVTSVSISDSQFTVTPSSVILSSGAKKEFTVSFKPQRPHGAKSGMVTFIHNGVPARDTIQLTGNGMEPFFAALRSLDFGNVAKGTEKTDTVRVVNSGNMPLTISSAAFRHSGFALQPASAAVPPGGSFTFLVKFAPSAAGAVIDTLLFTHDAESGMDTVLVRGTCTEALFSSNRQVIHFGKTLTGQMRSDSLTVTNTGNADLIISGTASTDSSFVIMPFMAVITPSAQQTFHVTFIPRSPGMKQAALIFMNNGARAADTVIVDGDGQEIIPILQARVLPNGTEVVIEGTVTRAMGAYTRMQDSTGGIVIRQTAGAFFDSVSSGGIKPGDRLRVYGITSEFNRMKQINAGEILSFERLMRDHPLPEAQAVTLAEVTKNGEQYESELITVAALSIVSSTDTMFMAAKSYSVVDATDSTLSVVLRISNAADTRTDSASMPKRSFTFTGVLGQFHATDSLKGYQLLPVMDGDVKFDPLGVADPIAGVPDAYVLYNNYPNPFNPSTTIRFGVPEASTVRLEVYDLLGRRVAELVNGRMEAGFREVSWNATVSTGIYLYRIESVSLTNPKHRFVQVKKMVLVK